MTNGPDAHIGRSETADDHVWPMLLPRMAATLGLAEAPHSLPPLWHWMLFQQWVAPAGLGIDGHARRGDFLPDPDGLPRRMWAGSRVKWLRDLRPGEAVRRISTITSVDHRTGRSGQLMFVTVHHDISGTHGPAIEEWQDIVYRAGGGATAAGRNALPTPPVRRMIVPDEIMLFRYSALTGNGHRIHYDAPYATGVENYPGRVVHGPLIATLLMTLAPPGAQALSIRALRPAFCGCALLLCVNGGSLQAFDDDGAAYMSIAVTPEA
jgi:hydroxyacyl-ACP dehydratase HTD2-like protein with hotdog domain